MSNPDQQIKTALQDLADEAGPPRIEVDDAWRTGRRRTRFATITSAVAVATAISAGLLTVLPGARDAHEHTIRTVAYVLDRAARTAGRSGQPLPHSGQYIAVTSLARSMTEEMSGSQAARAWLTLERRKIWWSVSNRKPGLGWYDAVRNDRLPWSGPGATTPLGVSWLPIPAQGCADAPPVRFTYQFLTTLPTEPAKLRAWIYSHKDGGQSADDQAWTDISDLLGTMLTPPRLTAALFRVAATIPGATVVPHVTDAAGRSGVAVARVIQGATQNDELIFNTSTYRLLGGRTELNVSEPGLGPPGTVIQAWALLHKTVVSHLPRHAHGHGRTASHC